MSYGTLSWALLAFLCASDTVAQGVGNQSMRVINPKPQRETLILNYEIGTSSPVHHPVFPCYQKPIPEDAERYPFPIINGRVQIQTAGLRYDGPLLTEHSVNGDWIASFYRGGFQGLSVGSPDVFTMREADFLIDVKEFEAGTFCGPPMPALTQVNEEPYLDPETSAETTENGITRYNVTEEDLDGVNATIAIEFVHFSPDGQRDEYLLTQPVSGDPASYEPNISQDLDDNSSTEVEGNGSHGSSDGKGDTADKGGTEDKGDTEDKDNGDSDGQATDTNRNDGAVPNPSKKQNLNIGAIAGGVSGAGITIIVIAALAIYRRSRRRRTAKPQLNPMPDEETSRGSSNEKKPPVVESDAIKCIPEKDEVKKQKKNSKGDDEISIGSTGASNASVYTEPPPVYEETPRQ
ncbi:hypothetical protein K4F52_004526 [Lecanicillium sp. MT-2017a]|nr:hypothetical protein K4F52_004526 [Lecanicillium sp. MT-2017a]